MMKHKLSIVGGFLADKILPELSPRNMHAAHKMNGINVAFAARLCSIKGKPSGGLVLSACGAAFEHTSVRSHIAKRLRAGWTKKDVIAAFSAIHRHMAKEKRLNLYREQAYKSCGQYVVPDDLPDTLEGHPIAYDEMTPEDCGFWIEYAKQNWTHNVQTN